jgi:hypothetical protein
MTNFDEKYVFTSNAKRNLAIILAVGVLFLVGGIFMNMGDSSHQEEQHAANAISEQLLASTDVVQHEAVASEEHHETAPWLKRLYADLWINNMFFVGLGVIGVFFFAIQYVSQSYWSTGMLRVSMAIGHWLPISFVMILGVFLLAKFDLFHWTHDYLYDTNSPQYDSILDGKKAYLNQPFFLGRMFVFIGGWFMFFLYMKKHALAEDIDGGIDHWKKIRSASAWFLVFFAVTSSMSAWDWIMSIDPHWFSTMVGWYVFSSWWVTGLAFITFVVILLKEQGYLSIVTSNHLHDMGKFIFGFSIFWTYLWFSQFLLIYYANIPEETVYFVQRMTTPNYSSIFYINLFINFVFPFLALMSRDSKRQMSILKIVTVVLMLGHWLDFYLMITPGVMKFDGGFGFMEIGSFMIFTAAFFWVVLSSLAKYPLIAKNHPTLQESLHHHI